MRQPQHLTDFLIDILILAIGRPCCFQTGTADLLIRMSTGVLAKRSSETVRNHRNAVRDGSEWLSAMGRNLQDSGPTRIVVSFDLQIRLAHNLAPLGVFSLEPRSEFVRRTAYGLEAQRAERSFTSAAA